MEPVQAAEEIRLLKGLFPKTTAERVNFWFDVFLRFPQGAVRWAIEDLARDEGDTAHPAALLNLIQSRLQTAESRVAAAKAEADRRAAAARQLQAAADRSLSEVDQLIAGISDDHLGAHKAQILAARPELEPFLAGRSPRRSTVLKGLIAADLLST